jgi:hypothetical protein
MFSRTTRVLTKTIPLDQQWGLGFQHFHRIIATARLGYMHDPVFAIGTGMSTKADSFIRGFDPHLSSTWIGTDSHH